MEARRFTAEPEHENNRLDKFLSAKLTGFTRSGLEKFFDAGKVLVNGNSKAKNYKLKPGDEVEVTFDEMSESTVKPQDLSLDIFYEDEHLLVVNKPRVMVVHPSSAGEENTLVNGLLSHCGGHLPTIGAPLRPGIVHRIDKDTSGLLVVAKTNEAHIGLARQVEAHTMLRKYEGVVHGGLKADSGLVHAPIGRHPVNRTRMCVRENGRDAVTHYRVLERFDGFCRVEFTLETGRMHQIRVHMAHIGHPVAGDALYSPQPVKSLAGQCLHAKVLGFTHPITGEPLEFTADLPDYFTGFLNRIGGTAH